MILYAQILVFMNLLKKVKIEHVIVLYNIAYMIILQKKIQLNQSIYFDADTFLSFNQTTKNIVHYLYISFL